MEKKDNMYFVKFMIALLVLLVLDSGLGFPVTDYLYEDGSIGRLIWYAWMMLSLVGLMWAFFGLTFFIIRFFDPTFMNDKQD